MRAFIKNGLSLVLMLMFVQITNAQVFYNNGADIKINSGAILKVQGSAENASGTISNDGYTTVDLDITNGGTLQGNGTFEINRHWINNATFLGNTSNKSLVLLNGSVTQNIQGSQVTTFWNLELDNGLVKKLFISSGVNNDLNLHNQELAAETYIFYVYNTSVDAISRDAGATYGFVSALSDGSLSRKTNVSQTYIYPVGSTVGTLRYRPIDIKPADASNNTYSVRMANTDATNDGYDRDQHEANICKVEPDFYHKINRTSGSANADIKVYYKESDDGLWPNSSNWNGSLWADMGTVNHVTGTPFNTVEKAAWSDFTNEPYALINISPIVTTDISDSTICKGNDIKITASGADSYVWSNDQDGTTSTDNPFTVSPSVNTIYTVTGTTNGCSDEATVTVNINDISITDFTNDNASCGNEDGTSKVNATGGDGDYAYKWSTSPEQTSNPATGLGADSYTVTVTDNGGSGCSVVGNTTISEDGAPTVTVSSSESDICPGEGVTLTANSSESGTTYEWTATNGTFDPTSADTNPIDLNNITENTTITVKGTAGGCSDVKSIDVNVFSDIVISNVNEICSADQATYTVEFDISGGDSDSYTVNGTASGSHYTSADINSGDSYSFTVTDANDCNPQTVSGTHVCTCPVSADITTNNLTICEGETADISIDLAGGTNPYSITYNDGTSDIVVNDINTSPYVLQVTPTTETTYTLVAVSDVNCTGIASGDITVSINDISITDFTNTDATCGNDDGQSTVNITGGDGSYAYTWSTSPEQNTNPATGLGMGSYTVTVTDNDGSGCSVVGNTTISEIGAPTISVVADANEICSGGLVTLTANSSETGTTYEWTATNGTFDPTSADVNPIDLKNITNNTTVTVTGTKDGCSAVKSIDINVYSDIVISNLVETCSADRTTYTVEFDISGGDPTSYTVNGTVSGGHYTSMAINSDDSYSFTVTDVNDCNPQTVSGTHSCSCPITADITSSNTSICLGETVTISISLSGGTFPYSITYNDGTSDIVLSGITESPYFLDLTPTETINYTFKEVSDGSCTKVLSDVITVVVNPLPIISVVVDKNPILAGESTTLTASGAISYQWKPTESLETPTEAITIANPVESTIYTVVGTDNHGCIDSVSLNLQVTNHNIVYVPNIFSPNEDGENDVLYVRGTGIRNLHFLVFDRWGELVFETENQSEGWDGTFRGKKVDPAVFVYYVVVEFYDGEELKDHGNVTLVK